VTVPGAPLTRQRSPWEKDPAGDVNIMGTLAYCYRRRVGDGTLVALVALEPPGWHLSVSFRSHRGELTRYPSWDELAHARYVLLPADVTVGMILPPVDEYVALHDTTFHLHEIRGESPWPT
jgi:hypothetical protein